MVGNVCVAVVVIVPLLLLLVFFKCMHRHDVQVEKLLSDLLQYRGDRLGSLKRYTLYTPFLSGRQAGHQRVRLLL